MWPWFEAFEPMEWIPAKSTVEFHSKVLPTGKFPVEIQMTHMTTTEYDPTVWFSSMNFKFENFGNHCETMFTTFSLTCSLRPDIRLILAEVSYQWKSIANYNNKKLICCCFENNLNQNNNNNNTQNPFELVTARGNRMARELQNFRSNQNSQPNYWVW